mmetsp:Transcript_118890/g.296593  ORF Transcript_118890/g.296593 Transcript_118890/m.296593 type:complete len:221 (+) Transcript_118890:1886-2548(+)
MCRARLEAGAPHPHPNRCWPAWSRHSWPRCCVRSARCARRPQTVPWRASASRRGEVSAPPGHRQPGRQSRPPARWSGSPRSRWNPGSGPRRSQGPNHAASRRRRRRSPQGTTAPRSGPCPARWLPNPRARARPGPRSDQRMEQGPESKPRLVLGRTTPHRAGSPIRLQWERRCNPASRSRRKCRPKPHVRQRQQRWTPECPPVLPSRFGTLAPLGLRVHP